MLASPSLAKYVEGYNNLTNHSIIWL